MPYIEQDEKRYLLGTYRATVIDRNDSPDISDTPHRGRLLCVVHFLEDDIQEEHPVWCDYCGPSHQFFSIPDVGTMVYVMFNGGNPEDPIWIGAVNTTNATKDPPTRFRRDKPDVSGYESLQGHFLEFDDIDGERHIRLEDLNGNYFLMDTELNDLEAFFANDERRTIGNDRFTNIGNDDQLDIGNDNRITIGSDQTQDIGNDQIETIGNDQTLDVTNNRTETIGNDDSLTVDGNKTQDITGTWDDTIEGAYSMAGQETGDWTFQDTVTWDTGGDFDMTATGDWKADITGDADWTITGDWKAAVTKSIEFTATQDIVLEATTTATLKNTLFEFTHAAAISTWKTGATSIIMTPASITITVGGTTQTWTAAGSVFAGSAYTLAGIDHLTHRHPNLGLFVPTGPPI